MRRVYVVACLAGDGLGPELMAEASRTLRKVARMHGFSVEDVHAPFGSEALLTMREWDLHWCSNIPSLVHKRSNSREGLPWSHPANAFAADYTYGQGTLPRCDDLQARGAILSMGSITTDEHVDDVIAAFRKVAQILLP